MPKKKNSNEGSSQIPDNLKGEVGMRQYSRSTRFDTQETTELIEYYKNNTKSENFPWINYLNKEDAREEIIARFNSFIYMLLTPCFTGKYNAFSSYQKTFFNTWAGKNVPMQNTAIMLYKELNHIGKDELLLIGREAIVVALETMKTNLASTIVTTLKDMLFQITKNQNSNKTSGLSGFEQSTDIQDPEILYLINTLDEHHKDIVKDILNGKNVTLTLNEKLTLQSVFKYLVEKNMDID